MCLPLAPRPPTKHDRAWLCFCAWTANKLLRPSTETFMTNDHVVVTETRLLAAVVDLLLRSPRSATWTSRTSCCNAMTRAASAPPTAGSAEQPRSSSSMERCRLVQGVDYATILWRQSSQRRKRRHELDLRKSWVWRGVLERCGTCWALPLGLRRFSLLPPQR